MYTGRDKADVFIIGGGPAGLAAAIAARKKGFSVIVTDGAEPPIDKACGEGMMPETQAALRELGVEVPPGAGYPFRGIQFVQGSVQVAVDFPVGRGIGVRRTALHELLIREAERLGVKLLWKTTVAGIAPDGVRLRDREVGTRWIIGADGGTSRVRRWSGLDTAVLTKHRIASRRHYRVRPWTEYMEIYWGPQVQAYVTPISMEEVCVVLLADKAENANFERTLDALPELRDRLGSAELCSRERGATTTMQSLARVCHGNVALVGDASGGVDAITGEGLRLAFRQALALAEAMECGDLRQYERAHRKLAGRPLWMGKAMLQLGRSSRIRGRVLRMLKKNPGLFARLLAIHVGRATTAGAVVTGVQAGWQMLAS